MSPANPTRLLLVRHAEVEQGYHKIFGGTIDMNISPRGHEQAATLAKFLRGKKMDAIYSSPMKRVQQTLAPFLKKQSSRTLTIRCITTTLPARMPRRKIWPEQRNIYRRHSTGKQMLFLVKACLIPPGMIRSCLTETTRSSGRFWRGSVESDEKIRVSIARSQFVLAAITHPATEIMDTTSISPPEPSLMLAEIASANSSTRARPFESKSFSA